MRHLVSIVLGAVLGVIVYWLLAVSLSRLNGFQGSWSSESTISVLAAIGAGLAYTALLLPRLSPLGPALAGAVFLILTLWAVSDTPSFIDIMPRDVPGGEGGGFLPSVPFTTVLAIPLLATLASGRRWRRLAQPAGAGAYPPPGQAGYGGPPPGYGDPPPGYGGPPPAPQTGFGPPPTPVNAIPGYPGSTPIGAPYSGPPSYSPNEQYGYPDPAPGGYGSSQQPGYPPPPPPDQLNPDVTRRL